MDKSFIRVVPSAKRVTTLEVEAKMGNYGLFDARSLPDKEEIKTDLCIVGAGTAGITLARKFKDREFRA
jgi:NADPH-dependent 2,4-dienoyl-CoA reductase/sulfur reductase-like enzyme